MEHRNEELIHEINDLPPEMLTAIFGYLERFADRDRAVRVCPLWHAVIDETVGVPKWVGKGSEFWDCSSRKWRDISQILTSGVSRCYFSDVMTNGLSIENVRFLRPHLVKRLEFDGTISKDAFETITKPLRHLAILGMHISTLSLIDINLSRCSLVQNLSKLCLTSEGFSKQHFQKYEMLPLYLNMVKLLEIHFPKLKTFYSSLPLFLDKEVEMFPAYTNFLIKHASTLEEISMNPNYRWRINERSSYRRTAAEVDSIYNELDILAKEFKKLENILPRRLRSLIFIMDERRTMAPTSFAFSTLMLLQTNLEKLYYVCWDFIHIPAKLISINSASMTEIGLTVNDVDTGPVNCSVFSECLSLKKLLLEADGDLEFNNVGIDAPRLQNAQALPKSLQSIVFRNIFIESSSVETISKELHSLESLFLTNIGKVDNLGMTVCCLLWILKDSPTIRKLKIKGFNDRSFEDYYSTRLTHSGHSRLNDRSSLEGDVTIPIHNDCSISSVVDELEEGELESLSSRDVELLDELMDETDMLTLYIPYISKKNGIWKQN